MLTGQWSGHVSNQRNGMLQSESVLQPSHFDASVEKRVRAARKHNASSPMYSDDDDDDDETDDELLFAQAQGFSTGRKQQQVPPSSTRRKRSPMPRSASGEML
jgi:hypothetical protein